VYIDSNSKYSTCLVTTAYVKSTSGPNLKGLYLACSNTQPEFTSLFIKESMSNYYLPYNWCSNWKYVSSVSGKYIEVSVQTGSAALKSIKFFFDHNSPISDENLSSFTSWLFANTAAQISNENVELTILQSQQSNLFSNPDLNSILREA